ncbi:MAG TPA: 4-(cytidine 5'-diphospho)-2-C-methyl-D-erythritol kinase [Gemmatimonadales bacterium]|nr:4-(cytidine 5'-diphospho)-2-C-methyl-D-erythritol kinase [Gemmatimonadales bacterium]
MTAPSRVRIAAHAKVNLFLRILARDTAGWHQVETALALLELADELVVQRIDSGVTLVVDGGGPDLGPAEDNLALRAARGVLDATGNRFGVALRLTKRIPVRAGLGGGSSDAAAALHAVNALAGNAVPRTELLHVAARLGADVPFFASGAPLALAWGRGERLFRLPAPPAAPALLAVPAITVATPDAYRWWDDANPASAARGPVALDAEAFATWGSIGRLGGNDFEAPVFAKHAELRELYERLAGTGPVWVRLCGSGSTVAAVYRKETERDDAAQRLSPKECRVIKAATRAVPAPAPAAMED